MKFKKYLIFLFLTISLIISCSSPTEVDYEELYNLVLIDSDGNNKKILADRYYGYVEKYFMNNNSQILLKRCDDFVLLNIDGTLEKRIPIEMEMRRSCISHDHSKVAFIGTLNSEQEIYLMDYNGNNLRTITSSPNLQKRCPVFSYDGNCIAYVTQDNLASIEILNISTGQVKNITQKLNDNKRSFMPFWYPIFSNDDKLIFFIYEYWNTDKSVFHRDLCSIDTSGNNFNIVENDVSRLGNILSSSKSEKLFYVMGSNPLHIFASDYNGLNKNDLGETPIGTLINISENDTKIVFGNKNSYYDDNIIIMNLDGSDKKTLSEGGSPVLSTDGTKVLFIKKELRIL